MKKFFIILFLTAFSSAYAAGHLSEKDKKATLEGRLFDLEFYLQSLQNVVSIISNEYKTID